MACILSTNNITIRILSHQCPATGVSFNLCFPQPSSPNKRKQVNKRNGLLHLQRFPDSDKGLQKGNLESKSETELNTPIPDLAAYLSSLEQQQQQLEQQFEQHEEQPQQPQEEQVIKEVQEQMEELQGKQEAQVQQNKTQSVGDTWLSMMVVGFGMSSFRNLGVSSQILW